MHEWTAAGVVIEGNPITIGGLNPWAFEWRQVQDEVVELAHPAYPNERHRMRVYEVTSGGRIVQFAAASCRRTSGASTFQRDNQPLEWIAPAVHSPVK